MNEFTLLKELKAIENNVEREPEVRALVDDLRKRTSGLPAFDDILSTETYSDLRKGVQETAQILADNKDVFSFIYSDSDTHDYFSKSVDEYSVGTEVPEYIEFDDDPDGEIFRLEKSYDGQVGKTVKEDILPAIEEYSKLFSIDHATPGEILTLARFYPDNEAYQKAAAKVDEPLVVGGPASVVMTDREGHKITAKALQKGFKKYMNNHRARNIMVLHSDVQVGWALPAYISKSGQIFKSGVNSKHLFLISELRDDTKISKRVAEQVKSGKLRSYSIAGSALDSEHIAKADGGFIKQVNDIELAETTICEKGVNQGAHFDLLKSEHAATGSCSDGSCLIGIEKGYDPLDEHDNGFHDDDLNGPDPDCEMCQSPSPIMNSDLMEDTVARLKAIVGTNGESFWKSHGVGGRQVYDFDRRDRNAMSKDEESALDKLIKATDEDGFPAGSSVPGTQRQAARAGAAPALNPNVQPNPQSPNKDSHFAPHYAMMNHHMGEYSKHENTDPQKAASHMEQANNHLQYLQANDESLHPGEKTMTAHDVFRMFNRHGLNKMDTSHHAVDDPEGQNIDDNQKDVVAKEDTSFHAVDADDPEAQTVWDWNKDNSFHQSDGDTGDALTKLMAIVKDFDQVSGTKTDNLQEILDNNDKRQKTHENEEFGEPDQPPGGDQRTTVPEDPKDPNERQAVTTGDVNESGEDNQTLDWRNDD